MNKMMPNFFQLLPFEIIQLILSSNELWLALEIALQPFARFCRQNKVSYYNQFTREYVFPEHVEKDMSVEIKRAYRGFGAGARYKMVNYDHATNDDCLCFYCYLEPKNKSGLRDITPLLFKQETRVWITSGGLIHRDYSPAIITDGYECYMRLGKKHRNFAPAEMIKQCSVEQFYENGLKVNPNKHEIDCSEELLKYQYIEIIDQFNEMTTDNKQYFIGNDDVQYANAWTIPYQTDKDYRRDYSETSIYEYADKLEKAYEIKPTVIDQTHLNSNKAAINKQEMEKVVNEHRLAALSRRESQAQKIKETLPPPNDDCFITDFSIISYRHDGQNHKWKRYDNGYWNKWEYIIEEEYDDENQYNDMITYNICS